MMWHLGFFVWASSLAMAVVLPRASSPTGRSFKHPPIAAEKGIPLTGRYVPNNARYGNANDNLLSSRQNMVEDTSLHYFATLSLGQQQRTYQVLVDTGSVDLVIFSSGVTLPDSDLSEQSSGSCTESYGPGGQTGSTTGDTYNGPYSFAGVAISGLFCLAPRPDVNNAVVAQDGILGLGQIPEGNPNPSQIAGQTGNNPLTAGNIANFGIYISSGGQGGVGQLTVDGTDPSYYQDEDSWTYEDVLQSQADTGQPGYPGYWQFRYNAWSCNGQNGNPQRRLGFIDTGNPTINLDHATVNTIYAQIGGGLPQQSTSRTQRIDCAYQGNAPDVTFTFGSGATYTIPSSIYVVNGPNGGCYVAFIALADDSSPSVFGAPFIQAYYTWFDLNDQLLGFNPSVG